MPRTARGRIAAERSPVWVVVVLMVGRARLTRFCRSLAARSCYSGAMDDAPTTRTDALGAHVGQKVTLRGWLYNKRSSGKLHFLEVRDGFGIVQGVMAKAEAGEEAF